MVVCPQCGAENRGGARFCDSCAAPLSAPAAAREQRKTVTVLFCDVTGSTELGEKLDPEALRALLARYFERMKTIVERHGGTVEKFIGDAVMAVFGVPVLHEDDALRALRAAVEMREAFPELGVRGRIGVTTGEVVTGTEERLATGDAVNVAARLEQTAVPGEILIGEETHGLTRDAAEVEPLGPRELKGKGEPVVAYRLLAVYGEERFAQDADAPMVGRERELRQLASVWERVVSESACQLFTILGPAGVGKSRLAAEFLASLEGTLIVRGRCLSYGEGITYWPVVEIVKQLPEAEAEPVAAQTIRALLSDQQLVTSSEEIAWAFRKQLEVVATERPLVCVFDDVHWGEETFLDLIEHVADLSRDASILLLCMARPDLLDRRTGWGGGKVNATTVLLEPLAPEETEFLIESLAQLPEGLRTRIRDAAEGNPLFVEEMVALLYQSGAGEVTVPPTIQALLAARLDQLEPRERDVLQCGSVEGRVFHRGAVQALRSEGAQVTGCLTALVRKELIRPDKAQLSGEDAFRFRHLLIRDAAYEALPKATRAVLHEGFAGWLEEHAADLVELDEMLGYHLEQAYRYRRELGQPGGALAQRAAVKLATAGRRALDRGDMDGASNLLERAAALLEEGDKARIELEVDLGEALLESGRLTEAESLLEETVARAARRGDQLLRARAQVRLASVHIQTRGTQAHAQTRRDLEPLVTLFEGAEDHRGAADTLQLLGKLATWAQDFEVGSDLHERALWHARRAGDERREAASIRYIVSDALWGPEHVEPALARCRAILDETSNRRVQANCLIRIGGLEGLAGRIDVARESVAQARAIMDDFGLRHLRAHSSDVAVLIELLAGDHEAAEHEARAAYAVLEEMGDRTYQASQAQLIAEALEAQGRSGEAEEWLAVHEALRDPGERDLALRARIMARRGLLADAEKLARSALEQGGESPVPNFTDPRFTLAEILARAGRTDEARTEAEVCLRRYEAKGIVPLTDKAQALLAEMPA
ncbi:MAG: adenylate/guanylate cyclase domain-containing protein [Gaiellaceae bacterium]